MWFIHEVPYNLSFARHENQNYKNDKLEGTRHII